MKRSAKMIDVRLILVILAVACTMGCKDLLTDYKLDTDPDYLKSITLLDYIAQGRDTTLTLYAKAIAYADLADVVSEGSQTRVVPTNSAIRTILLSAGVSRIEDLSPNVVRGLLSYLTFAGAYRSIDLGEEETIERETRSGEPMYLTRHVTSADKYRLAVNDFAELATPPIEVIRQDYVFSDGVAHVVDFFPSFQKAVTPTDSVPEDVDYSEAVKDTIWISEDAHAYAGGKNNNYDTQVNQLVSRSGQYRYTFFKFKVDPIDFAQDLTSATLNFSVEAINGSNFIPFCGIYETTDNNWEASTLNWNNMPGFGAEVATKELGMGWNEVNITGYMQNILQEGKAEISLGLQLLNGANVTSSSVRITNSEASRGAYRQFISLMGPMPTEMQLNSLSAVTVTNNGSATLTKGHVSMSGTSEKYVYTDNNILFALIELPANGTITKYGLPLGKYAQFTQEQLANGAIKYVHHGGGADTFGLKALDYIGGVYPELLHVPVIVQ